MTRIYWVFLSFVAQFSYGIDHDFKGFDDSILFGINWPGNEIDSLIEGVKEENQLQDKELLTVRTSSNEVYNCYVPELSVNQPSSIEEYNGPSPLALLKPLFAQKVCSYRLESYWSYEVCHGRHVRQYHEERDGKQVKGQKYYLGNWDDEKQKKLEDEMSAAEERKEKPKHTKVDGMSLPYIELVMGDGSICDLSGKPRVTKVLYVCYNHGKHEVYSFKETLTCEYEIVVLSPLLCSHPQFKPQEVTENAINCYSVGDAPKKPRNLLAMEAESLKMQHQTVRLTNNEQEHKDVLAVLKVEQIEKDGETHLKIELRPLNEVGDAEQGATAPSNQIADKSSLSPVVDDSPVRAFLNGENCLSGGNGWWKYEFCYGKHVEQYHIDRTGVKTSVLLGSFDEALHLEWIKENKSKAPKSLDQRTSISHLYSNGDICDKTGKPRQTEVKLKCIENSSNSAQVSLYLLEPRTCQYILGVESPLICDILPLADEHGLVKSPMPFSSKSLTSTQNNKQETGSGVKINDFNEEIGND